MKDETEIDRDRDRGKDKERLGEERGDEGRESERERERDRDCERLREIERDPPTLVIIKEMNEILLLWFLKKTHRVEEREVSLKRT